MVLTQEEGRDIVYNNHEDWIEEECSIIGQSRWNISYEGIFKHIPSNKYYLIGWTKGATEYQDNQPFEYNDPEPIEVHQVEKTVKVWEPIK